MKFRRKHRKQRRSRTESDVPPGHFDGEYPIIVEGLVNRFGDKAVHEDLSLKVKRARFSAWSAARARASRC